MEPETKFSPRKNPRNSFSSENVFPRNVFSDKISSLTKRNCQEKVFCWEKKLSEKNSLKKIFIGKKFSLKKNVYWENIFFEKKICWEKVFFEKKILG